MTKFAKSSRLLATNTPLNLYNDAFNSDNRLDQKQADMLSSIAMVNENNIYKAKKRSLATRIHFSILDLVNKNHCFLLNSTISSERFTQSMSISSTGTRNKTRE